jgi:hypothetical protein
MREERSTKVIQLRSCQIAGASDASVMLVIQAERSPKSRRRRATLSGHHMQAVELGRPQR